MESITGIGDVVVQRVEYLSPTVLSRYTNEIGILKTIMDKQSQPNYNPTIADYNTIVQAVQNLADLARNGVVEGDPNSPYKSYLNGSMADNLNLIMQSLRTVGISSSSTQISLTTPQEEIDAKLQGVQQWQSLGGFGVKKMLSDGVGFLVTLSQITWNDPKVIDPQTGQPVVYSVPYASQNTFQSLLESQYVATGNSVISSQLNSMETALKVTSDLLSLLKTIQNLSNNIQVATNRQATYTVQGTTNSAQIGDQSFSAIFQMPTTGSAKDAVKAYSTAASQYFSQLSVVPTGATTATELYQVKNDLYNALLRLEAVDPQNTRTVTNSLASNIFAVIRDISAEFAAVPFSTSTYATRNDFMLANPSAFNTAFKAAADKWVIDNQNVKLDVNSTSASNNPYQTHLAAAITNSQILNDQQRDNVRRYMLVFEEFYKSAASMLELLSSTIVRTSRKPSGG